LVRLQQSVTLDLIFLLCCLRRAAFLVHTHIPPVATTRGPIGAILSNRQAELIVCVPGWDMNSDPINSEVIQETIRER
jgi:hypothetical protein